MNCLYPDGNDEFIVRINDLIVEPENANGSGFLVDAGRSPLPSKQPCIAASTETQSHPITRIGSELEALIAAYMDEGNDITSIFCSGKAPTSHAVLSIAAHSGMCSYPVANIAPQKTVAAHSAMTSFDHSRMTSFAVASFGASNATQKRVNCAAASDAPQNTGATYRGMTSFEAASIGACDANQTMMGAHSGIASFAVASFSASNTPPQNIVAAHSGMTSFAVASFGATNAAQNMVAAHAQLPPVAPSSNFGGGE